MQVGQYSPGGMPAGCKSFSTDAYAVGKGRDNVTAIAHTLWTRSLRHAVGVASLTGAIVLAGCSGPITRAPIVDGVGANQSTSAAVSGSGTYVVKPGDTLYGVARATNTDFETIKRLNNLTDPNQLTVGQVLRLNGTSSPAAQTGGTTVTGAGTGAGTGTTKVGTTPSDMQPRPLDDPAVKPPVAATPKPTTTPTPAPAADAGVIHWAWPIKGTLIQTFTANSKGIDIAGTPGDPIKAAADGKVMYIGNGVRGLGNLVIVNHDNGFITVYGHNRSLLVKTGQQVKRGDKIAELGQTDTSSPRLHFEVRRRGTPTDPLLYLPAQ